MKIVAVQKITDRGTETVGWIHANGGPGTYSVTRGGIQVFGTPEYLAGLTRVYATAEVAQAVIDEIDAKWERFEALTRARVTTRGIL